MSALEDQISSNKIKSYFILIIVPIILVALSAVLGMAIWNNLFTGIFIGTIVSLLYTLYIYSQGASLILSSVGAVPATDQRFINLVEDLTIASGLPMPKLYVQNSPDINAFAAGKDPKNAVICVTTGALEKLSKQELEGVLAHEMSHIKNFDVRFMTITVALVGAIAILSQMFLRSMFYSNSRDRSNGNAIFIVLGIALAILAPLFATLAQLAVSRKREYLADASGAYLTRNPEGLASALEKIRDHNSAKTKASGATASLYISNPFNKDKVASWFSTHPPLDLRIKRLREA